MNNIALIPQVLPGKIHLVAGDTWLGFTLKFNPAPVTPLALVTMRFQRAEPRVAGVPFQISSGTPAEIAISSATLWEVMVPAQILPLLTAGSWWMQMAFTDAAGVVQTYIQADFLVTKRI
jgi:hypothetical protein